MLKTSLSVELEDLPCAHLALLASVTVIVITIMVTWDAHLDSHSCPIPEASVHLAKAALAQQRPQLHILKGLILALL